MPNKIKHTNKPPVGASRRHDLTSALKSIGADQLLKKLAQTKKPLPNSNPK
jgi:hypothetical protein